MLFGFSVASIAHGLWIATLAVFIVALLSRQWPVAGLAALVCALAFFTEERESRYPPASASIDFDQPTANTKQALEKQFEEWLSAAGGQPKVSGLHHCGARRRHLCGGRRIAVPVRITGSLPELRPARVRHQRRFGRRDRRYDLSRACSEATTAGTGRLRLVVTFHSTLTEEPDRRGHARRSFFPDRRIDRSGSAWRLARTVASGRGKFHSLGGKKRS